MKTIIVSRLAIATFLALGANSALASETGFTAFECVEIESSIFEKEASGVGSSCNLIGRKQNAENRAVDELEENGQAACEAIRDGNPSFWDAYCQAVCEYNGYDESQGPSMCSYRVTDTDTWEENGCVTGDRQFNRKEADVQCGCFCTSDL